MSRNPCSSTTQSSRRRPLGPRLPQCLSGATGAGREYRQGEAIHEVLAEIDSVQSRIDRLGNRLTDDDTAAHERDAIRERLDSSFRDLERLKRELERTRMRYRYDN